MKRKIIKITVYFRDKPLIVSAYNVDGWNSKEEEAFGIMAQYALNITFERLINTIIAKGMYKLSEEEK